VSEHPVILICGANHKGVWLLWLSGYSLSLKRRWQTL